MMEFRIQQTPSFGLSSSVKYNGVLTAHVEYSSIAEPYNYNDNERQQHRESTHRFPVPSVLHKDHNQEYAHTEYSEKRDHGLRFIPPGDVQRADGRGESPSWIVIDDIVYDVTDFAKRHPGGQAPLRNLSGKSCSWQFHQIHAKDTLEVLGAELRIGRTSNVPNPYEAPKPVPPIPLWRSHVFQDSQ